VEVPVGQDAAVPGLAFPDQGGLGAPWTDDVTVEAVVCDVQLAADEPLGVGGLPLERLLPRLEPVEVTGPLFPESDEVLPRLGVDRGRLDQRILHERLRRRELPVLAEQGLDRNVLRLFRHRQTPQREWRRSQSSVPIIAASGGNSRSARDAPARAGQPTRRIGAASRNASIRASSPGASSSATLTRTFHSRPSRAVRRLTAGSSSTASARRASSRSPYSRLRAMTVRFETPRSRANARDGVGLITLTSASHLRSASV